MHRLLWCLAATAGFPALAGRAADPGTLYADLQAMEVSDSQAFAITDVLLPLREAELQLASGVVYPIRAGEREVGAVFVGEGTFRFTPPPGVESHQLRKFTGSRRLEERFDRLLLFGTAPVLERLREHSAAMARGEIAGQLGRARDLLADRLKYHLKKLGLNWRARVFADLVEGRRGFLLAEPRTRGHGFLTLLEDPLEDEPVALLHWSGRYGGMLDTWCSIPDPGAPGPRARVEHYDLRVELDGDDLVEEVVRMRMAALDPDVRVLTFRLNPRMEVRSVERSDATPLWHAREKVERKTWERELTVALDRPLRDGDDLIVRLGGELVEGTRWGRLGVRVTEAWYPLLGERGRATYTMRFKTRDDERVYASGRFVREAVEGDRRVSEWEQRFPVAAVSFTYGDMPSRDIALDGVVPVTVFGRERGLVIGDKVRDIGEDVAKSLAFFSEWFGPYPFSYMTATAIPYHHGQGFPGLLQLADASFGGEARGVGEAFRGHEVAHQWWGHLVSWKSYRDQWLSEGFAEYSGALFAAETLGDPELLERMLEGYRQDILGRGNLAVSKGFSRFGMSRELMRHGKGSEAGALSLGLRLSSSESPVDYSVLVYEKGAWVLHMLRMLLRDPQSGSDARFKEMMRDFTDTYRGCAASAADFQAIAERHVGASLQWFFDQWVDGTVIPRYEWAWTRARAGAQNRIHLRVRQVLPDGELFRMPVPVRIKLAGGGEVVRRVDVIGPEETFVLDVSAEAVEVELNPGPAVLCETKEKGF